MRIPFACRRSSKLTASGLLRLMGTARGEARDSQDRRSTRSPRCASSQAREMIPFSVRSAFKFLRGFSVTLFLSLVHDFKGLSPSEQPMRAVAARSQTCAPQISLFSRDRWIDSTFNETRNRWGYLACTHGQCTAVVDEHHEPKTRLTFSELEDLSSTFAGASKPRPSG